MDRLIHHLQLAARTLETLAAAPPCPVESVEQEYGDVLERVLTLREILHDTGLVTNAAIATIALFDPDAIKTPYSSADHVSLASKNLAGCFERQSERLKRAADLLDRGIEDLAYQIKQKMTALPTTHKDEHGLARLLAIYKSVPWHFPPNEHAEFYRGCASALQDLETQAQSAVIHAKVVSGILIDAAQALVPADTNDKGIGQRLNVHGFQMTLRANAHETAISIGLYAFTLPDEPTSPESSPPPHFLTRPRSFSDPSPMTRYSFTTVSKDASDFPYHKLSVSRKTGAKWARMAVTEAEEHDERMEQRELTGARPLTPPLVIPGLTDENAIEIKTVSKHARSSSSPSALRAVRFANRSPDRPTPAGDDIRHEEPNQTRPLSLSAQHRRRAVAVVGVEPEQLIDAAHEYNTFPEPSSPTNEIIPRRRRRISLKPLVRILQHVRPMPSTSV